MAKFRKKPVVIEAMQFDGTNHVAVKEFMSGADAVVSEDQKQIRIWTLESHAAPLTAVESDWIIKGIKGEFYPCRADIFAETYEPEA